MTNYLLLKKKQQKKTNKYSVKTPFKKNFIKKKKSLKNRNFS